MTPLRMGGGAGRATPRICELQPADLVLTSLHTTAPTLKAPEVVGGRSTGWARCLWAGGMQYTHRSLGLDPCSLRAFALRRLHSGLLALPCGAFTAVCWLSPYSFYASHWGRQQKEVNHTNG